MQYLAEHARRDAALPAGSEAPRQRRALPDAALDALGRARDLAHNRFERAQIEERIDRVRRAGAAG